MGAAVGKGSLLKGLLASTGWGVPFYWEMSCRSEGREMSAAASVSKDWFLKILSDALFSNCIW